MSSENPLPVPPMPMRNTPVHFTEASQAAASQGGGGLWDRVSTWASENKAVVYTIAGVAIVVSGAGVAYYLTDTVSEIRRIKA